MIIREITVQFALSSSKTVSKLRFSLAFISFTLSALMTGFSESNFALFANLILMSTKISCKNKWL